MGGPVAVFVLGVNRRGPRYDEVEQGRRGSEDAVVGELVFAWMWGDCDQTFDEKDWVKAKGLGAVAPGGGEFPEDLAFVG